MHYDSVILNQTHDGIQVNSYGTHNEEIAFTNTSDQTKPVYIIDIYATVGYEKSDESIAITALPAFIK
ncbi:hypothetical protein FACS1894166_01270 [Bacilli bacterium]|nr:hypothetical protein FACS1894166_01270 [Bacilli bacterium]